jgi:hypothetical protein
MNGNRFVVIAVFISAVSVLGGMWISASAALARPLLDPAGGVERPQLITHGNEDVNEFFKAMGYKGDFQLITAVRDGTLSRRYYQVRVNPNDLGAVHDSIVRGWTWGHFNRAVYENCASARLPRSRNLPKWWKQDAQYPNCLMLDHGGIPGWYVVIQPGGEVDLMWSSR